MAIKLNTCINNEAYQMIALKNKIGMTKSVCVRTDNYCTTPEG